MLRPVRSLGRARMGDARVPEDRPRTGLTECGSVRSLQQRPRTNDIVPPAVWQREASFSLPASASDPHAYTRHVRRWVCIIALLAGFSGSGYAWSARPRIPVPIERVLPSGAGRRAIPGPAWWSRA
jgi:hypothetical protein